MRGGGDAGWRHLQCIGTGDKIVFVSGQERQDRRKRRLFAERGAQFVGGEAGEREQSLGARFVPQYPAERLKRQRRVAVVHVVFPFNGRQLCHAADSPKRAADASGESGKFMGKTILVVEDNELNLRLFCDLLNAHGYSAHPVRDGRDALARAREVSPDLIIMDIQLPHVSGLDLIGQMKADLTLRAVPIMAVTAYAGKGDEEQIRAAGAEAYVSKPISVIKFIESVGVFA